VVGLCVYIKKKKKNTKTRMTTTYYEDREEELSDPKGAKIDEHIPSGSNHSEYNDYASISDLVREGTTGSPPPLPKPMANLRSGSLKKIHE